MQSVCAQLPRNRSAAASPFDLENRAAYLHWRDNKLRRQPRRSEDLIVEVGDPRELSHAELEALQQRCSDANMVVYRSRVSAADKDIARRLGTQLGLHRLDHNWLADEDGISSVTVGAGEGGEGYIPYTNRAIRWHTDGYYHPPERCIRAMILHCVAAAASGGVNRLVDHEMAYIALRDANPEWVHALMSPEAMTIPARMTGDDEEARAAQAGPVFSIDTGSGALHMRYTARTRSIAWRGDEATRAALAFLMAWLDSEPPCCFSVRLEPGMGIVAHNVLHDRSGFDDDPARPRLLYRARYLDRIALGADVGDRVR
jgi:alpha-ketoglutarate-dependent taurine dioxygenase